jgi:hypothetical protein
MEANVVSLRGVAVESDRRTEFVRRLSDAFDEFVAKAHGEPEAMVVTLCGLKQPSQTYWLVQGDSEGGARSVLALAALSVMKEAVDP